MNRFPKQRENEALELSTQDTDLPAKYGLPEEVKFCKICVLSNQRPASAVEFQHEVTTQKITVPIGESGICDACRFHRLKHREIDWEKREFELRELCDRYRSKTGKFDCLVPGSGGKDSIYAAHLLKYKFGMHPLTVTWAPHIYTPCEYGESEVTAIISKKNIYGFQFHPEKSGEAGLEMLRDFIKL